MNDHVLRTDNIIFAFGYLLILCTASNKLNVAVQFYEVFSNKKFKSIQY